MTLTVRTKIRAPSGVTCFVRFVNDLNSRKRRSPSVRYCGPYSFTFSDAPPLREYLSLPVPDLQTWPLDPPQGPVLCPLVSGPTSHQSSRDSGVPVSWSSISTRGSYTVSSLLRRRSGLHRCPDPYETL